MRGIVFPGRQAADTPYTYADYTRCKPFADTIGFGLWWSKDWEQQEYEPWGTYGRYHSARLARLRVQVDLAKANGFTVVLHSRVSYNQDGSRGWADLHGAEWILTSTGRARYMEWLTELSRQFPDCHIDPWYFPFHGQSTIITDDMEEHFYSVFWPAAISAIRTHNKNYIMLECLLQGSYPWIHAEGRVGTGALNRPNLLNNIPADRNVYFGINTHDGADYNQILQLCQGWNYDRETLRKQMQPAIDFVAKGYRVICCENFNLQIHRTCTERPIDQSRLDLQDAIMRIENEHGISWLAFRYENPVANQCPFEPDFSHNQLTELLIARFNDPTPTPPIIPIVAPFIFGVVLTWLGRG